MQISKKEFDSNLYEIAKADEGVLVQEKDTRSSEKIYWDAVELIQEITGFTLKNAYKSSDISIPFYINLQKLGLSPKDGHNIFESFIQENREKPVSNVHNKLDLLIYEYINGINKGICLDCGKELLKYGKYCTHCGNLVTSRYRVE